MALTARRQRFVEEYLKDCNATQAAIRAGYAEAAANREGSRLLSNVDVQEAIAAAMQERSERTAVDTDFVLRGLARESQDFGRGSSPSSRVSALSWLGKHLAMFTDRHEHTFPDDLADAAIEAELQRLVSEPAGANGHTQEPPRGPGGPAPNGRAGG